MVVRAPLRGLLLVAFSALLALLSGCVSTAQFHSRTGEQYPVIAAKAVPCDDGDIQAVQAAGGIPIGTIDAKGLTTMSDDDKAAKVAARRGGTHVLLSERGEYAVTYVNPGQEATECQNVQGVLDCQSTFTPPTQTTVHKPTAKFVVYRVPRQNWSLLPDGLRPVESAE